jgi:hypothetical protein
MYIYIYMHVCVCVCVCVYIYMHVCVCMCVCVFVCVCTYYTGSPEWKGTYRVGDGGGVEFVLAGGGGEVVSSELQIEETLVTCVFVCVFLCVCVCARACVCMFDMCMCDV